MCVYFNKFLLIFVLTKNYILLLNSKIKYRILLRIKGNLILHRSLIYSQQLFILFRLIYLDPKRLSCRKAILAILNPAHVAAAKTGKRTIKSRMSMTYSSGNLSYIL
jgi:hypothetical protein